ncbi:unnamed protein product [Closterium sp. Naga37s-1]|nr:unnamed protein product [Closterium sp. Naga37s-1]
MWKPNVQYKRLYSFALDRFIQFRVTTYALRCIVKVGGIDETRRMWKPNVQYKRLYSFALDKFIQFRVTTYALRCIDKVGGIDEYLLHTPEKKLNSDVGLVWKGRIQEALRAQSAAVEAAPATGGT